MKNLILKIFLFVVITANVSCLNNNMPNIVSNGDLSWQYSNINAIQINNIVTNSEDYQYLSFPINNYAALPFISYPIIDKSSLIIMDKNGQIKKYKNKNIIWSNSYGGSKHKKKTFLNGGLCYDQDIIFASYGSNIIRAINANTGDLIWETKLNDITRSFPLAVKDKIIVQAVNNSLYAINKKNGNVIWHHFRDDHDVKILYVTSPVVYKDLLILQHKYGISIIDSSSGVEKIFQEYKYYPQHDNKINGIFQTEIIDNFLIFYDLNGYLNKYDLNKNTFLWQKHYKINRPIIVTNKNIFALDEKDKLMKINFLDGETIWSKDLKELIGNKYTKSYWNYPISFDNKIYLLKKTGHLLIIDEKNGEKLSFAKKSWQNVYLPPIASSGQLLILDPK